ncbi:hypothetical protein K505DRAFT_134319 [Melanomma pulvis-pyrius CBS 109.77]|uniref:Uncharacterized protein n=1 Tax=Melanomma pulvis-pyrius CBS 109.77 TaxID=1314802 RepID=A0A6A6WSY6_9PLEO|nr:hypothetical protein K505DRAFT_134319 [Melanomma pulvis-pyrius CBS 109.77]
MHDGQHESREKAVRVDDWPATGAICRCPKGCAPEGRFAAAAGPAGGAHYARNDVPSGGGKREERGALLRCKVRPRVVGGAVGRPWRQPSNDCLHVDTWCGPGSRQRADGEQMAVGWTTLLRGTGATGGAGGAGGVRGREIHASGLCLCRADGRPGRDIWLEEEDTMAACGGLARGFGLWTGRSDGGLVVHIISRGRAGRGARGDHGRAHCAVLGWTGARLLTSCC